MSVTISKDTIYRLVSDIRYIQKNPLSSNGIYYIHDESNMLKGYALIIGPKDTPYENGFYFFEFLYPFNYPYSPPVVKYHTNGDNIRFNPNLYQNGKVCVSILNTWSGPGWTSSQTISSILLTLSTLLCENPLINEPMIQDLYESTNKMYNTIIQYYNIKIAICYILDKNINVYQSFFDQFYEIMREHFLKCYEDLVNKCKQNLNTNNLLYVSCYQMTGNIDYYYLLKKLENIKKNITLDELDNSDTLKIDNK
jgi:ubiquitin-conjugating enzyme E2 Z